ncbi:L-threonylcarbamoyladenylate synthase [Mechercharimyces sp. CAU 1602]|uniref:L-threonylcarbamoyladenylate synthase n=1 Tax=Mechercharimyces sp. CAU 1602 TaxID=2973933 RepID=UPI00216306F3|nr:L-threonylcarbamoyladenylate synthase [Mechercharimyces sp. CAU 1602]MCS1352311.1 L-threonylcarbamoyladenylate synthase [Mechercharimyces sp. CAU 1602]
MKKIFHREGEQQLDERKTQRWEVSSHPPWNQDERNSLQQAAQMLMKGKLVAFPTETVYGLGADATSEEAVYEIFRAKGRPADNPLIVHIGQLSQVEQLVSGVSSVAERLMYHFWPGPLTLILPHNGSVATPVTAGLDTVGIRFPRHPVAEALLKETNLAIAAPSANRSGRPSPTEAAHVWSDLQGRIGGLLDSGSTGIGVESTVVDVSGDIPMLLRPGGIAREQLMEVVPQLQVDPALIEGSVRPRSPGMKYRHYAPMGDLWLVDGKPEEQVLHIQRLADEACALDLKVAILTTEEHQSAYGDHAVILCGRRSDPSSVAHHLFRALRQCDQMEAQVILAETFPSVGLFDSVMNRLQKAGKGMLSPHRSPTSFSSLF